MTLTTKLTAPQQKVLAICAAHDTVAGSNHTGEHAKRDERDQRGPLEPCVAVGVAGRLVANGLLEVVGWNGSCDIYRITDPGRAALRSGFYDIYQTDDTDDTRQHPRTFPKVTTMTGPVTEPVVSEKLPKKPREDVAATLAAIDAARQFPGQWVAIRTYTSKSGPYQGRTTYSRHYEGEPVEFGVGWHNGHHALWARWTA